MTITTIERVTREGGTEVVKRVNRSVSPGGVWGIDLEEELGTAEEIESNLESAVAALPGPERPVKGGRSERGRSGSGEIEDLTRRVEVLEDRDDVLEKYAHDHEGGVVDDDDED